MAGATFMSDGSGAPGPYSQTPYKLVTTDIESVLPENYINAIYNTEPGGSINTPEMAFDGSTKEAWSSIINETNYLVLKFDPPLVAEQSVQIYVGGVNIGNVYYMNGRIGSNEGELDLTDVAGSDNIGGSDYTHDWTGLSYPLTINEIACRGSSSGRAGRCSGVIIDGNFVLGAPGGSTLTFPGDVSQNPDLQYFRRDDLVQDTGSNITADVLVRSSASTTGLNSHFGTASDIPGWIDAYNEIIPAGNDPAKQYYFNEITDKPPVKCTFGWQMFKLPSPRSSMTFTRSSASGDLYVYGSASGNDGTWTLIGTNAGGDDYFTVTNDSAITYWALSFLFGDANTNSHHLGADGVGAKVISTGYPDSNTMVVDGGTWAQGDVVEYQTNGGEGTVVSVNTDNNTILLNDTGDRDNRWIADNKAATDFYVAGPDVVDDPLLTADVELESTLFSTTPDGADTLKNIVWELNGVTQDAGLTNPYKPTGLALNTTYTVRVKHQGNSLADSAWSTSTTFTTGATRNLYTYYQDRIAALVSRIEALES